MTTNTEQDKRIEELWETFADIPMDPNTECIEAPFLTFEAGTHREEIWHWFDENHSRGVYYLLYHAGLAPSIKEADMGTLESEYALTDSGRRKCECFIKECVAKRKEILDAALDTCEDTCIPTIEDIESDINLLGPDEEDEYYNSWGVTDHYDSPPISLMLGIDFVESKTSRLSGN